MMNFFKKIVVFGLIATSFFLIFGVVMAVTNINSDPLNHSAWNDIIGWLDFYDAGNVQVNYNWLEGWAISSVGNIALSCSTTPSGNDCGGLGGDWHVVNDNGTGDLSGWAWNDNIGWISFWCGDTSEPSCTTFDYQVKVDANGNFNGWAWNDLVGWISFNCNNPDIPPGGCTGHDYKVATTWRPGGDYGELFSSIYDTNEEIGVAYNTLIWQGLLPAGTAVKFQFASSNNSAGPWSFKGPDGTDQTFYTAGPDIPMQITTANHYNQRYFRYYMRLETDLGKTASPIVEEVTVTWSI